MRRQTGHFETSSLGISKISPEFLIDKNRFCFISLLYLDLYVLGDDALIS